MTEWCGGAGATTEGVCADDFAGADDAGVVGVEGKDEGGVAGDPAAFPTDLRDGVVVHVVGSGEDRVGCEAEERVRAELEGPGEVVAGGDEDLAATEDGAAVDGLLDGGGVFGGAVAEGAVVADVKSQEGFGGGRRFALGLRGRLCQEFGGGEVVEGGDGGGGEERLLEEAAASGEVAGGAIRHAFLLSEALSKIYVWGVD